MHTGKDCNWIEYVALHQFSIEISYYFFQNLNITCLIQSMIMYDQQPFIKEEKCQPENYHRPIYYKAGFKEHFLFLLIADQICLNYYKVGI